MPSGRPIVNCDLSIVNSNHLDGLHFALVHRMPLILHLAEVDALHIDAADVVVVRGLIVHLAAREVYGRCPLRSTRYLGALTRLVFGADGDVKVVQYVEALRDGAEPIGLLRSRVAEESCTYKA